MKYQRIKIFALTVILISLSNSSSAQIKLWESSTKRPIKTQGVFCVLEHQKMLSDFEGISEIHTVNLSAEILGVGATALIGAGLSTLYTGLVQFTSRDEKQYSSKINAVNSLSIKPDNLHGFLAKSYYLPRKESVQKELFSYEFIPEVKKDSVLTITMRKIEENFIPVRLERKHHFVSCVTTLTVKAIVKEDVDGKGTILVKTLEIGKMNFSELSVERSSLDLESLTNTGKSIVLPKTNEKGGEIEILEYVINYEISHENPIGSTQRDVNRFLTSQADNSGAVFEALVESLKSESAR